MAELKSGVIMMAGETLVAEIEADLWSVSANPLARMIGDIKKFVYGLLGTKRKGFIVITDKRVVEVFDSITCYIFNTGRTVRYLLPQSIKEVAYIKRATCGFFCPAYYLVYEGLTQSTSIMLQDASDASAQKLVDSFYKALTGK